MNLHLLLLNCLLVIILGGHELLDGLTLLPDDIQPHELLIAQFDNRPLADYWNVSTRWNQAYCHKHGHQYVFLVTSRPCEYDKYNLAPAWCKVKAMVAANEMQFKNVKAVLFLDSDSIISVNASMTTVLAFMQRDLGWDVTERPVAFNQDGPGWACKNAFKNGYTVCLNSGAVFWLKSNPVATTILAEWWTSAGEPYGLHNKFTSKWRIKWPWEQAQQYEVYGRHNSSIQLLSFPSKPFLPWTSTLNPKAQYPTDVVEPWCFSHWPGAQCFITHYCSSKAQKEKMRKLFDLPNRYDIVVKAVSIDSV